MTPAKASGSNHLRHCPKHKKPLPCAHCALVKPKPLERPTPEPPAEPSVSVANEITVAVSPAAARAKRWREEQKKNNPDFEKQEAERKKAERAEADRREGIEKIVHSNPDPAFVVSDAPHGNQSVEVRLSARRGLRIKQAAEYLGNYYVIFKDDLDAYVDSLRSKAGVQ